MAALLTARPDRGRVRGRRRGRRRGGPVERRSVRYDAIVLDLMLPRIRVRPCAARCATAASGRRPVAHRARRGGRPGQRPRRRGRRLPSSRSPSKSCSPGCGRSCAGRERAPRRLGRRPAARSGRPPGVAGRRRAGPDRQGVLHPRAVHAAPRRGALARRPSRARLGLRLRQPTRTWSTSTSATCARRSTGPTGERRCRRSAARATGWRRAPAGRRDPHTRDRGVRRLDGGGARRHGASS